MAMREAVLSGFFLDLQKAYDALDQERSMVLIAAYRVGPRTLLLLWTYWDQLTLVTKSCRYFGLLFKGYRGVTQGDPLSPTIFNVVMYSIIRHWVTVMTPAEAGTGGLGLTIIDLAAYLYDDDGLVASTQPERLHRSFDVLAGLFDHVSLRKNMANTVVMVCQPRHTPHATCQAGCWRRPMRDG